MPYQRNARLLRQLGHLLIPSLLCLWRSHVLVARAFASCSPTAPRKRLLIPKQHQLAEGVGAIQNWELLVPDPKKAVASTMRRNPTRALRCEQFSHVLYVEIALELLRCGSIDCKKGPLRSSPIWARGQLPYSIRKVPVRRWAATVKAVWAPASIKGFVQNPESF